MECQAVTENGLVGSASNCSDGESAG